ncbi:MAG: response regulator receiver domain [Gammaproteobacteria bacterium]|nr:response regulator receiver domain [Gammaproteobacteria bacterium]MDE0452169.1 response regulator receiver domain [Gammaproteobacteria bacterium]
MSQQIEVSETQMSADAFAEHCRGLVKRFLQTAIVVDDEALMSADDIARVRGVETPTRQPRKPVGDEAAKGGSGSHSLYTKGVIDAFSELGVICGVIGPTETAMDAIRQADIVVLDWRLKDDDSEYALKLLKDIVTGEIDRNALRLVAFYTGEADLVAIREAIEGELRRVGFNPQVSGAATVVYRHGRVVLYAKPSVNVPTALRDRRVEEEELPNRLVDDFSEMTTGLLPSIALTSLTAVRECAHMVLDRFCSRLDPAFLAHRTCLPNPDDAERQMVNHVAEELRGLMDYAVADQSPAGERAVAGWIRKRAGDPPENFRFGQKSLTNDQALALAKAGLSNQNVLGKNEFECLSTGFGGGGQELDEELAWIITSRTVFNAPPPTLCLGTVVGRRGEADDKCQAAQLVCVRPRCDSVRLSKKTSFAFLPLGEPRRGQEQLIVKADGSYRRRGIGLDASGWEIREFEPDSVRYSVVAQKDDSNQAFVFVDADGNEYEWLGELKAEFAQRIAQVFADTLSRVAVDQSEWLRRSAQKGA